MIRAGDFEISVSDPYPCWIKIRYNGDEIVTLRHRELRDLEFAVSRAIAEATRKLPDNYKDDMK